MIKIISIIAVLLIGEQSFSQAKKPGGILAATTEAGDNIFIKESFESKNNGRKTVNNELGSFGSLR